MIPTSTGIVDYTIGGLGSTGPTGYTGASGATVRFEDLRYLADCGDCDKKFRDERYDEFGIPLEEPPGATGWYFGATGASSNSYRGPDYTAEVLAPKASGEWSPMNEPRSKAYAGDGLPTYIDPKYADCMSCGCPINHTDNKEWRCEIAIEVDVYKNTRCETLTVYLIPNPEKARLQMQPNLTAIRKIQNRVESLREMITYAKYAEQYGASGPSGPTGPSGASGASGTGYYIIDGFTGKILGPTGSSQFVSAYKDLVTPTRVALTKGQIKQLEDDLSKESAAIRELTGDPATAWDLSRVTDKKVVLEVPCECSGEDSELDFEDAETIMCYVPDPDGEGGGSYLGTQGEMANETSYFYSRGCCCESCTQKVGFTGSFIDPSCEGWARKYPSSFSNPGKEKKKATFEITSKDVWCNGGDCTIFLAIDSPGSGCYNPASPHVIPSDDTSDKSTTDDYFSRASKNIPIHSGWSVDGLYGISIKHLCGKSGNPDSYGNNTANTSSYHYDFTLGDSTNI